MLNSNLGRLEQIEGRSVIRTERGRHGHALYGPYVELQPGHYAVEFNIVAVEPSGGDPIVAAVDVVADFGATTFAREDLKLSRLGNGPVRLMFELLEPKTVEYRVFSPGEVPLIVDGYCPAAPIRSGDDPEVALARARFPAPASSPSFFDAHRHDLRRVFEKGVSIKVSADEIILSAEGIHFHARIYDDLRFIDEIFFLSAYNFRSEHPTCVIDVGMNIGLVSLLQASRPFVKEVHAFELIEPTYRRALDNLALNPELAAKIRSHNYGIAGRNERKTILVDDFSDSGCLSVHGSEAGVPVEVDIRSASETLKPILAEAKRNGLAVVAKIDCEGAEFDIFDDLEANGLFGEFTAFMLEWHTGRDKTQHDLFRPLLAAGFTVFDLSPPTGNGFFYAARTC